MQMMHSHHPIETVAAATERVAMLKPQEVAEMDAAARIIGILVVDLLPKGKSDEFCELAVELFFCKGSLLLAFLIGAQEIVRMSLTPFGLKLGRVRISAL